MPRRKTLILVFVFALFGFLLACGTVTTNKDTTGDGLQTTTKKGKKTTTEAPIVGTEGLYYLLNDDGQTYGVSNYIGTAAEVVVPPVYNGKPVTSIKTSGFYNRDYITSVSLPNSLLELEHSAFDSCDSLTSITIPASVTKIAGTSLSSIPNITFAPGSPFTISDDIIYGYDGTVFVGYVSGASVPETVSISDGVKTIADYAFYYMENIKSVILPQTVNVIGKAAFYECAYMTSITMPDSMTSIGEVAFSFCKKLTSIVIPSGITTIEPSTFSACWKLASVTFPEGLTHIGSSAFANSKITELVLPDSLLEIGESAFFWTSLTSVTLGSGLVSIGTKAFNYCNDLNSIVIPLSVTEIGSKAFSNTRLQVYARAASKPAGWADDWYPADGKEVVWGYSD